MNEYRTPSDKRRTRRKRKRKDNRALLMKLMIPVVIVAVIAGIFLFRKYAPSEEMADLNEYFGLTESADAVSNTAVVVNGKVLSSRAYMSGSDIYLSIDTVQDELNDRFYWDYNEQLLLYAGTDSVTRASVGTADYYIGNTSRQYKHTIVHVENDIPYISLDFVKDYTDLSYDLYSEPSRVVITTVTGTITTATCASNTRVRVKGGIKSDILKTCEDSEKLTILEELDDWDKVLTEDGYVGYVSKRKLSETTEETVDRGFEDPIYNSIKRDFEINLTWDQILKSSDNYDISTILSSAKGINVISPTWFTLNSESGDFTSFASLDYVNKAHAAGVEVWPLISDIGTDSQVCTKVLTTTSLREHLETQIIAAALEYKLDGINLDFESLSEDVGDSYIQFVRELAILCENNNIVLSADVYKPLGDSVIYNRKELGTVCDYVILFGYDEHYEGSEAGSVSSIPWVTEAVTDSIAEGIPNSKLILGVPFYTRLWEITTDSSGEPSVSSKAIGIMGEEEVITSHGVTPTWDDSTGQNYVEYNSTGSTYQMWIEDATSMEERMNIIDNYSLAGVASWRAGFETSDIWDVINSHIN